MLSVRVILTSAAAVCALGFPINVTSGADLVPLPIAGTTSVSGPIGDVYVAMLRASYMALADNREKLAAAGWSVPENGEYPNEDPQQKVDRAIPTMQLQMGRGARIIASLLTPIVVAQSQEAARSNALIFGSYLQGPSLQKLDNFLVGMMLADTEAKPLANFAATVLEAKTAAVIFVDDEYGRVTATSFGEAFTASGGKVSLEVPIPTNPTDFRNEALRIATESPDIVYLIHRGGYTLAIETMRDAGYEKRILSGSAALVAGDITPAAAEGEGMIVSTIGTPEARAEFRRRYESIYGEELSAESALISYSGTEVLIAALMKIRPSPTPNADEIEAAWMGLGSVETKVGTATIDRRALIYPISLESVGDGGELTHIGSCDAQTCVAQK
jgi:hypothetical protein